MNSTFVANIGNNFDIGPQDDIKESIFKQYERVIIESLITSFGLDFLINDKYGGDVDTILNVRKIDSDNKMKYKNDNNRIAYETQEEYYYPKYHGMNDNYRNLQRSAKKLFQASGNPVKDEYTGKDLYFYSKGAEKGNESKQATIDHVLTAETIHKDRGRVLSGLKGEDLANSFENLAFTNKSLNSSMGATKINCRVVEIPEYIEKHPELPEDVKIRMMDKYNKIKKSYETKLATKYYTSKSFARDISIAAGTVGIKMGLRQALGFIFAEIWFAVKEEFNKADKCDDFNMKNFFKNVAEGVKRGVENAKNKYRELFEKFKEGALSGILASVTTTICNIFFTTAKNTVKIIRRSYVSLVQAAKILLINPDNYLLGDRICAAMKVMSVGASVVFGTLVSEALGKTFLGSMPVLGDVVQSFCGALTSGILSCTFLYFFDNSSLIKRLTMNLNTLPTINTDINYFVKHAQYFELLAAQMMEIDIEQFKKETKTFNDYALKIEKAKSPEELNRILKKYYSDSDINMPWTGDFDSFMANKNNCLRFE